MTSDVAETTGVPVDGHHVSVRGLTVETTRTRTPVVEDISFDLSPGQIMGLVGESGSGKSTVGVALLGKARRGLQIRSGNVMVGEVDVLTLKPAALRDVRGRVISYVPQDPASGMNPAMRVRRQLREAFTVHEDKLSPRTSIDESVAELLEQVNIGEPDRILAAYPHELSGGQLQRIAIAMAFACRPRLVVLDEPTTGLDVTTQRHVLETVRQMAQIYDVSAVYVSHDLAVVAEIAEQTAVMYAGRIVEKGPTAELFATPRHHYTVGLLRAAPTAVRSAKLVGIEGRPPRPGSWPQGCGFAARCAAAQDDCSTRVPELAEMSPGRQARCLYPNDQTAAASAAPVLGAISSDDHASALTVDGLTAGYGGLTVIADINMAVPRGSCVAIVGQSGSGKTTLGRCLVGLHSRWTGSVRLGDEELDQLPRNRTDDQRRKLQYVFQNPYGSLNPRMSVGENLGEPLRHFTRMTSTERHRRVATTLDSVALSAQFAQRMPDQLSGGERQRVAIGRALVVEPEVIICDEVTSALDVSVQALIVEQLRELQEQQGLSLVFITHNLAVVRSIAQNVIVLQHGRIVESGPVDDTLEHPENAYTKQLLRDLPDWT